MARRRIGLSRQGMVFSKSRANQGDGGRVRVGGSYEGIFRADRPRFYVAKSIVVIDFGREGVEL